LTRVLLRAGLALGLLGLGFLAVVAGLYGLALALGRVPAGGETGLRVGFALYFGVILVKGLLPQWAACAALLAAGARIWGARRPRGALPAAALLAHAPAAWLLPRSLGELLPPLTMRHAGERLGTAALLTAAVVLAWWAVERVAPPRASRSHGAVGAESASA